MKRRLYSILKASKINPVSAPDMFTALMAKKLSGGSATEHEYTGAVPYTFTANGEPLIDYLISGNMVQNGTPSPTTPIQPQECGERTAQLFDKSTAVTGFGVDNDSGNLFLSAMLSASDYINISGESYIRAKYITSGVANQYGAFYDSNKTFISGYSGYSNAIAVPQNAVYTRITVKTEYIDEFMLNTGSSPRPYEPYGYKIPISSASTTTPVYLGEVQTTRKVKKLVLTGDESNWGRYSLKDTRYCAYLPITNFKGSASITLADIVCSHYITTIQNNLYNGTVTTGISGRTTLGILITDINIADENEFKTFLRQQYAAGTPVTVWYVLNSATTGIVNEPLMKIGDYADSLTATQAGVTIPTNNGSTTIDVETAVKPSEVYIKWKGV